MRNSTVCAAGHVLGPWGAVDPEVGEELELQTHCLALCSNCLALSDEALDTLIDLAST
jgi:hypothetical protein